MRWAHGIYSGQLPRSRRSDLINMSVSRQLATPLYLQLYETLRAQVQSGALPAGALVPAESELMRRYRVSRITVRSALDQLAHDGVIVRQRGRGTFVRRTPRQEHRCLQSFTDTMLALGREPGARLLRLETGAAAAFGEVALPFGAAEEITLIERLRTVDGCAAALIRSYIPRRCVPAIASDDFAGSGREQSLLHLLEHRFGVVLYRGEETVAATCLSESAAALLELPCGTAVVEKTCSMYAVDGEPLLYERALWCTPQTHPLERRPPVPGAP